MIPALLDPALRQGERIDVFGHGQVAGTLLPAANHTLRLSGRGFPVTWGCLHSAQQMWLALRARQTRE